MAVVAGIDKDRHGVTGNDLTLHCVAYIIARANQVTIDAKDGGIGVPMHSVSRVLSLVLVASSAEGVGIVGGMCILSVDLVAGCAGHLCLAVKA